MVKRIVAFGGRLTLVALTGSSSVAMAQSAAPIGLPSQAASAQADGGKVEEIVVTAQKRSQNLQSVPISVVALTSEKLAAAGVSDTRSLGTLAPGLTVVQTGNAPLFFLRGVGTALTTPGDEGSVNVLVDGVVYVSLPGSVLNLNNISQVEVLRGPQGTLFGRNASGGVISISTRDPSHTPALDVTAGYGNYDTYSGSIYATGGLGKNLAANIAFQASDQDKGWGTNLFSGKRAGYANDYTVRGKLLWTPDALTTLKLTGDFGHDGGDQGNDRRIIRGAVGVGGLTAPARFYDVDTNFRGGSETNGAGGVSLEIQHDLGWAQIKSITAYRKTHSQYQIDQDGTQLDLVDGDFRIYEHQLTQEVQLSSPTSSRIKWIVGGFYLDASAALRPLYLTGLAFAPLGGFNDRFGNVGTRSIAGFGQVTVPIGDRLNLTGGLRYTSDKRDFSFHDTSGLGFGIFPVTDTSATFNKLTWHASVDYKVTGNVLAYASISRGFKAGTFNIINPANPPIKPETLTSYEGGLKTTLFDHHLRFNVSGFYYDYKDIQVGQVIGGNAFFLNAPKATIYGADVDFEVRPVTGLSLSGGAEFLHSRYDSFPNAPITEPAPATCTANGIAVTPGPRTGGNVTCAFDASGHQLVRAPDFNLTTTASYVYKTGIGEFGLSGTIAHSSSFPWEPDGRLRQKPLDLLSGQLSWMAPGGRYEVKLWGRNLSNEHYYYQESSSLNDTASLAPPRTYGVTLGAHF